MCIATSGCGVFAMAALRASLAPAGAGSVRLPMVQSLSRANTRDESKVRDSAVTRNLFIRHSPDEHRFLASADIRPLTRGPTVISWASMANRKCRHDGWELSELTDRRGRIDRPPQKTARGKLGVSAAIDPKALRFRFTYRMRHDHQGGVSRRAAVRTRRPGPATGALGPVLAIPGRAQMRGFGPVLALEPTWVPST